MGLSDGGGEGGLRCCRKAVCLCLCGGGVCVVGRQAEAKDFIWSIRSPGHVRECVIVWCVGNLLTFCCNQNRRVSIC
jgi:hypothetical protein